MIFIDGYPMDLAVSEEHTFQSEITEFPVEDGAAVSDHIRVMPTELTVEAIVSSTPIGEVAKHSTRVSDGVTQPLPPKDAYDRLTKIREETRLVTVETSLDIYRDMGLAQLSIPRTRENGDALFFTATFRLVVRAESKRTRVRVKTRAPVGAGVKKGAKTLAGDRLVLWRWGQPPGAPLKPGHDWAGVIVNDTAVSSEVRRNLVKAGFGTNDYNASSTILRFSGSGSKRVVATLQGGAKNRPLSLSERAAFALDMERDRKLRNGIKPYEPGFSRGLPQGLDLSRFQTPGSTTFPATGPTTTFPPGTLRGP